MLVDYEPLAMSKDTDSLPLPISNKQDAKSSRRKNVMIGTLFILLLMTASQQYLPCLLSSHFSQRHHPRTNIILMISDGYGPASETFGRSFHQALKGNTSPTAHYKTPLDKLLVGSHRSRSSDSLITDSAAGATAFACGVKSYNGAIGVDEHGKICATIFEGAKEKGMLTGVVVTTRLTDATPASFVAHVASRGQESDIAEQILGLTSNGSRTDGPPPLDLAIGGGGCYFLPRSDPFSCRGDDMDLVSKAKDEGWRTHVLFNNRGQDELSNMTDFHQSSSTSKFIADSHPLFTKSHDLPLLALLAPANTPYEIDRRSFQPSLSSLAMKALETLDDSPLNKHGFLIMIEGSQIDLCAHQNDPACHAREIEAYQETIGKVTEWVNKKNRAGEETILISTSDHETGGLTLGKQLGSAYPNYAYYPESLIGVKQSAASLSAHLFAYARTEPVPSLDEIKRYIREEILIKGAAFTEENRGLPQDADVDRLFTCLRTTPDPPFDDPPINIADDCRNIVADLISRRAQVGWSTSGHTGVDVPVHVLGSNRLKGNMENTDIAQFIAKTLSIDLAKLTKKLRGRMEAV